MKKQQHILTIIIILAIIACITLIVSMIYDEKIKQNKKAIETIVVPKEAKEETIKPSTDTSEEHEKDEEKSKENTEDEYIGEEEKQSQKEEEKEEKENKDEKSIKLAQKEWGDDNGVSFSIAKKENNKYYVAVKQDATVIQWYEVDTEKWTISEY